jgi:hypothetical protein
MATTMGGRVGRSVAIVELTAALVAGLVTSTASAQADPVTIDIYVLGSGSGGIIPLLSQTTAGVDAAVDAIGKEGKVTFNVATCDAKGDINALRACGQQAVAAKPDAILSADVGQTPAGLPDAFQTAQIPVFWIVGTGTAESTGDTAMRPSGDLASFGSIGYAAARAGFKKDAVLVSPPVAAPLAAAAVASYEAEGGTLKAQIGAPFAVSGAPAPDYAPTAQKVVDESPGVVLEVGVDVLQSIRGAGFAGPVFGGDAGGTVLDELYASLPDEITRNLYKTTSFPPFDLKKPFPTVQTYIKALKATGHDDPNEWTAYGWNAWLALHAIASVTDNMSDVTSTSLLDALNSSSGIKLASGATWVPSGPGPTAYPRQSLILFYMAKYVGDGKWKLVETPKSGVVIPPEVFDSLS